MNTFEQKLANIIWEAIGMFKTREEVEKYAQACAIGLIKEAKEKPQNSLLVWKKPYLPVLGVDGKRSAIVNNGMNLYHNGYILGLSALWAYLPKDETDYNEW